MFAILTDADPGNLVIILLSKSGSFITPVECHKFIHLGNAMMKKLSILSIMVLSLGCATNETNNYKKATKTSTTNKYPVQPLFIDNGDEEGWGADIRLSLTEIISTDSMVTYKAISSYEGKKVGLEFTLPIAKPATENSPTEILQIKTCGENSDNLLRLLSKLYRLKVDTNAHFISSVKLAFVDLNEFARSKFGKDAIPQTDSKEMKLFFETEDPEDYAELYVNINDKEHWLELREKDEGYRRQVIKFLTAK